MLGVTALVIGPMDRTIALPVERLVVLAMPTVPEKPFGITLSAPYLMKSPVPKLLSFGPSLSHCRNGPDTESDCA